MDFLLLLIVLYSIWNLFLLLMSGDRLGPISLQKLNSILIRIALRLMLILVVLYLSLKVLLFANHMYFQLFYIMLTVTLHMKCKKMIHPFQSKTKCNLPFDHCLHHHLYCTMVQIHLFVQVYLSFYCKSIPILFHCGPKPTQRINHLTIYKRKMNY